MKLPKLTVQHLEHYAGMPLPADLSEAYEKFYPAFERVFYAAHPLHLDDILLIANLSPACYWDFTCWRAWNSTLKQEGKTPLTPEQFAELGYKEAPLPRKARRKATRSTSKRWQE